MLTFREEWYDDRLQFDGLNGESYFHPIILKFQSNLLKWNVDQLS